MLKFLVLIHEEEGTPKKTLLAKGQIAFGVKRSTIYDYYDVLLNSGEIVEDGVQVWTKNAWEAEAQRRESEGLHIKQRQLEHDAELARRPSLEAFIMEPTESGSVS
jgi:hypothetical protein